MNRIVKILLVVLTILVIAGAGFWSGFRYGNFQAAASIAASASAPSVITGVSGDTPPSDSASANPSRPDFNGQRDFNRQGDASPSNNYPGGNRSNPGAPQVNNSGIPRMPQGMPNNGMMMAGRSNTGLREMSGLPVGSLFMGGGMLLFGLLFPLGFAVLMVLGIIILFRLVRHKAGIPVISTAVCAKCNGVVQAGWKYCPHCGEMIA